MPNSTLESLRNIIWTLVETGVAYGLFAVAVPRELLALNYRLFPVDLGVFRHGGLILIIAGAAINLRCYWDLVFSGQGSPDPLIPTEKLVSRGLYRYTRNPVYLGFFLILSGEAVLFTSALLVIYSLLWLLVLNWIVVFIEEPSLRRRFGDSYEDYLGSVPRWIPRVTVFRNDH